MSVHFENLQRSTTAFVGALFFTVVLVAASAPAVPLV